MAKPLTPDERADITRRIKAGETRNAIAKATGRSAGSITRIADDEGLSFDRSVTRRATEAKRHDNAAKRAALIEGMYDDALKLRGQMFAPCVAMNFGGKDNTYNEHPLDEPTFADKRNIAVSVKVLADGAAVLERVDQANGDTEAKGLIIQLVERVRAAE